MSYTVYGVRLKGEREARYIGQTAHSPALRLTQLRGDHGCLWQGDYRGNTFGEWLHLNRDATEAFEIARCETRAEAKATERLVIAVCLALNHRLFNGDHVPRHLRIEPYPSLAA